MARRPGLGRGLDTLIPDTKEEKKEKAAEVKEATAKPAKEPSKEKEVKAVPKEDKTQESKTSNKEVEKAQQPNLNSEQQLRMTLVVPNPNQPRKSFDKEELEELAASIKEHGVIQPIIVTKRGEFFEIIAGERRWRAAKLAGLVTIPAIVRDYTPAHAMEIAIIENIQRSDLNPIEEAMAYQSLVDEYNITQDDVAKKVGKSRAKITNSLRLLRLSDYVKGLVEQNRISPGHARALVVIDTEEDQKELADRIIKENLSVRDIEKILSDNKQKKEKDYKRKETGYNDDFIYQDMVKKLERRLGTKVFIKRQTKQKGQLIIEYYTPDEFEQLYNHISR